MSRKVAILKIGQWRKIRIKASGEAEPVLGIAKLILGLVANLSEG
ncbi:hypothetical protein [Martelella alba]|nr:hypothetical protein [Martelella alba]